MEPTDNEIIMYISIAKACIDTISTQKKRDKTLNRVNEYLAGYAKMPEDKRKEVADTFRENAKKMEDRIKVEKEMIN